MGNRVIPEVVSSSTSSNIANIFISALNPFNTVIDTVTNLGSFSSDTLLTSQNNLFSNINYQSALPNIESGLNNSFSSLKNNVNTLINFAPQTAENYVNSIASDITFMTNRMTSAFNLSNLSLTDIKGGIFSTNSTLCGQLAGLIQGGLSKITGMVTSMQRAALAAIDKVRQEVVKVVKQAVSDMIKVLPTTYIAEANNKLQDAYKSVLGKISSMVSIIDGIAKEVSDCAALAEAAATFGLGLESNVNLLLNQVKASKDVVGMDFDTLLNQGKSYLNSGKNNLRNNGLGWLTSNILPEQIGHYINDTLISIENTRSNLESLQDLLSPQTNPNNPNDHYWFPDSNTQRTYEAATDMLKDLNQAKEYVEECNDRLVEETKNIITELTEEAINVYETIEKEVEDVVTNTKDTVDNIFDNLLDIAENFDDVKLVKEYTTCCSESEFRTIINED